MSKNTIITDDGKDIMQYTYKQSKTTNINWTTGGSWHLPFRSKDFVGAILYCPNALPDGN